MIGPFTIEPVRKKGSKSHFLILAALWSRSHSFSVKYPNVKEKKVSVKAVYKTDTYGTVACIWFNKGVHDKNADAILGNQDYYAHALGPVERALGNIL